MIMDVVGNVIGGGLGSAPILMARLAGRAAPRPRGESQKHRRLCADMRHVRFRWS